jgi:angiogenesis inhibitor 1
MKITKPSDSCLPRQVKTFQFDSFIETSRTYLGMESFDEVVRLCDASTSVTYLESSKQFLQLRKVAPRHGLEIVEGESNSEFKAEFLVVGKRNPSMPACQKLCQWLENCLSTSTHPNPCGIMNTPCQCWETPVRKPGGCYRGGVYLEQCIPTPRDNGRDIVRDTEIISE